MSKALYISVLVGALILFIVTSIIPIILDYLKKKRIDESIGLFSYYTEGGNVIQTAGIFGSFIVGFVAIFFAIDSNVSSSKQMELSQKMFKTTSHGIDTNIIANNRMIYYLDSISKSSNNLMNNMNAVSDKLSHFPGKIDSISQSLVDLNKTFIEQKQVAQKDYATKIKPILVLTTEEKQDSCSIILWNSGSGIAYDINIETHLAKNIGNIGVPWIVDVIQAAKEIKTKDFSELWNAQNSSYNLKLATNHPLIMPSGIIYGYRTSGLNCDALSGVFAVIRYRDEVGNKFYSFWDGWGWKFGEGEIHPIPIYDTWDGYLMDPVTQFMNRIMWYLVHKPIHMFGSKKEFDAWVLKVSFLQFDSYLFDEADYLDSVGYNNVRARVDEIYERDMDN